MEVPLFEQVADVVRAALPPELGAVHHRAHAAGCKVWFGGERPDREHYEAQLVRRAHLDGGDGLVLEIGFHAEHPREDDNEQVLAALVARRATWRRALGADAVAGPFLGAANWRRLSETWLEPDLREIDAVFDVADRLTAYIVTIEPLRRRRRP